MPTATKEEFLQNYNSKRKDLGKPTHDEIAQAAYEALHNITDIEHLEDVELIDLIKGFGASEQLEEKETLQSKLKDLIHNMSLVEKTELITLVDAKYASCNDNEEATANFLQPWQEATKSLLKPEEKDEKTKNIKWRILVVFTQIVIMAAVLLMIGLLLTNPIMALAIGKVVATFTAHTWSSLILPLIIQNAFTLSIMLPLMVLAITSIAIIDYRQTKKANAEACKAEEKNVIEYYKNAIQTHVKTEDTKKTKSQKTIQTLQEKRDLLAKLKESDQSADTKGLQDEISRMEALPAVLISRMQDLEEKLFELNNKTPKPISKQVDKQIESAKDELKSANSNFEKEALKRYTNSLTAYSAVEDKSHLTRFLDSAKKPETTEPATKDLTPRPWYKRLFSSDINKGLILSNLANACKLLDSTTEGQTSTLTASEKTVCKLLNNKHSAYDLYVAGFSIRDIKFAVENSAEDKKSINNLFLNMYNTSSILPEVIIPAAADDNSKEIAAIKDKLVALKKTLNTLKVTEQDIQEALDLDREEKSLLTENDKTQPGTNEETKTEIRNTNDRNAYNVHAKKAELLAFKAEKSSAKQLAAIAKTKAEITALQSRLSKKITVLSTLETPQQTNNNDYYQIFDTTSFFEEKSSEGNTSQEIEIALEGKDPTKELKDYLISIPKITDDGNIFHTLRIITELSDDKKEYLVKKLCKAHNQSDSQIITDFIMNAKHTENLEQYHKDIDVLKQAFSNIDCIDHITSSLEAEDTKSHTSLLVSNGEGLQIQDPTSKDTIKLLERVNSLDSITEDNNNETLKNHVDNSTTRDKEEDNNSDNDDTFEVKIATIIPTKNLQVQKNEDKSASTIIQTRFREHLEYKTAKARAKTLIDAELFSAIGTGISENKGLKAQTAAITAVVDTFKQNISENKVTNDMNLFTNHIEFAKTQQKALENRLENLEKLKHAAEYSKADSREKLSDDIASDISATAEHITDLKVQIEVLGLMLNNNDNINSMMIKGITQVYTTLKKYQTDPTALLPVKEKVKLSDYQPKPFFRSMTGSALTELFNGLATEKRIHEVKVELDSEAAKEFDFDNSPAYKTFCEKDAYKKFSATIKDIDKKPTDEIAKKAQKHCNEHRHLGSSASFFAPNYYMDDQARSSKEEKIAIVKECSANKLK